MEPLLPQEQGGSPFSTAAGPGDKDSPSPCSELLDESQSDLVILHFNDVYEVESRQEEPVGGAAR